jgi:hypothetical protein
MSEAAAIPRDSSPAAASTASREAGPSAEAHRRRSSERTEVDERAFHRMMRARASARASAPAPATAQAAPLVHDAGLERARCAAARARGASEASEASGVDAHARSLSLFAKGDDDERNGVERQRTLDRDEESDASAREAEATVTMSEAPFAPFPFMTNPPAAHASAPAAECAPVGELFAQLVTRAAVGGDAHRASMRLELGGRVAGRGRLTVHAEGDEVEIELTAPPGVDAAALEASVTRRLASKGLRVTRFDVG